MTEQAREDAAALLRTASEVYAGDRAARARIAELELRLREPLRLAIAGMVKAGKSTLVNAMLGEQIAPTGTAECTRVVTWYRYSATPTVTLHPRKGEPQRMPVRREEGRLVLDLGDFAAEEVDWIDVGWPLAALRSMILIDTPGIASLSEDASARAMRFLTPEDSPSAADAVVYLMRHLHGSDVGFLEAFRDTAAGAAQTVCAVGVLSRSDEIGSGRIDALLSAGKVARRYERDGDLATLVLGVIPVAGLVAEGARTLRESEYRAFRHLAEMDRGDRERLLVSADRFIAESTTTPLSAAERRGLLARFGMFGVRLATALIRGGAVSSSELAESMVQQSGLVPLQQFVRDQFRTRAATLKVRGVLLELEKLIREHPRGGAEAVHAGIERLTAGAHELRELSLLAKARASGLSLPEEDAEEAQTIIGGRGTPAHARLGLPEEADAVAMREQLEARLAHWRRLAESPVIDREAAAACRVVIRSLDELAAAMPDSAQSADAAGALPPGLGDAGVTDRGVNDASPARENSEIAAGGDDIGSAADVVPTGGPRDGLGHDARQQREEHEGGLPRKKRRQWFPLLAERHPLD